MALSLGCWSSVGQIEMLAGVGFVDVGFVASAAVVGVNMGVLFLCRDMEDTWRGMGSGKGLVVILVFDGKGSC